MTEKKLICVYLFILINSFGHLEMPQGKAELQVNKFVNTTINSGIFETNKNGEINGHQITRNQIF